MTETQLIAAFVGAVVAGGLLGWFLALATTGRRAMRQRLEDAEHLSRAQSTAESEAQRRQALETELEKSRQLARELERDLAVAREKVDQATLLFEQQKQFVDHSREDLQNAFSRLANEALKGSSEQFLRLAKERLDNERNQASADLDERKQAIEGLLKPLKTTVEKLDENTRQIEKTRVEAYSRIDEQVRSLSDATASLQEKTMSLETALRGSQVRGRWGELALRNVAELAGMTAHCDFEEQVASADGKRPDMTVNLPGERKIAIDAKAPLTGYLEAMEATDEGTRKVALGRHVKALRGHIRALAARDYSATLGGKVDLVVMFLPGDPFLSAAFAEDPDLQVEALRAKVLIATPSTLVALLRTVAIYWQQQTLAESAETIAETARTLYERAAKFGTELASMGRGLSTALDAYNRAVGSFGSRLMPMARRLEELKVTEHTTRAIPSLEPIGSQPREPLAVTPPEADEN